ncbi:MAG: PQQ-dependent sugar dehydrogenase [Chitinophagaceae bacterium]
MKKYLLLFCTSFFAFLCPADAQIVASRTNEVFLKTNLSTGALNTPWEITLSTDGFLWITDAKTYKVYRMDPVTGTKTTVLDLSETSSFTPSSFRRTFNSSQNPWPQGGLAGLAFHPNFLNASNPKNYVYISYVHSYDSTSVNTNGGSFFTNRIVRFTYNTGTGQLESPVSLCDTLPGSVDHNSQRMIIAPVGGTYYLFYGSGDMGAGQLASRMRVNNAQKKSSYEGKILRFNLEPDTDAGIMDSWIPNSNPYNGAKQSAVWCIGIRNNQGFAYDSVRNILYGSSHGPYSDDEVNIIEAGANYGHPSVIGFAADENYMGSSAGANSGSSLPVITSEVSAAAGIGSSYRDPLFAGYAQPKDTIYKYWSGSYSNAMWPSEAWSGLDLYNYSIIPGWKNSLLMAGLKWGRIIRTKLDNNGTGIVPTLGADTVINFDGLPRYRDMAFGANGKDIYLITDNSVSNTFRGTNNAALPACNGCVQKFTFLGYNSSGGISTITTAVPIAAGIINTCQDANDVAISTAGSNNNLWVPITDTSGNIVAEINANGNNLGVVSSSVYTNGNAVRESSSNNTLYLDRNITITPQFTPASAVSMRFYLTNAEFNALKNANNSLGQSSGVVVISNLSVFTNNDPCSPNILTSAGAVVTNHQAAFGSGGYVVQANISSLTAATPTSFYMAAVNALLPFNKLALKGVLNNNIALLNWQTEADAQNASYVVERSSNNKDFYMIAIVQPVTGVQLYKYADTINKLAGTTVYYRIRAISIQGQPKYSDIITLNPKNGASTINLYPNPANETSTLTIDVDQQQQAFYTLIDLSGKILQQKSILLSKGKNNILINVAEFSPGIYLLKVNGSNINESVKLVRE